MNAAAVSVVIPARNAARFLAAALASVRAQTRPVAEILVVDDGSTDATARIAEELGARVVCQPAAGAAVARNRGATEATGDWLAFLDADDLWTPEKTARQLAWLEAHPGVPLVFGHGMNFVSEREGAGENAPRPAWLPGAALIRREFFLTAARFDPAAAQSEVVAWILALRAQGVRLEAIPELVLRRRLHADNTRRQGDGGRKTDLQLVRAHLARQRAGHR